LKEEVVGQLLAGQWQVAPAGDQIEPGQRLDADQFLVHRPTPSGTPVVIMPVRRPVRWLSRAGSISA